MLNKLNNIRQWTRKVLNYCGNTVVTTCINQYGLYKQYTGTHTHVGNPEYKSSTYPLLCPQTFHNNTHSILTTFTAVTQQLIPTIHITNKNYKKFFSKKLLFIYPEVV